MGLREEFRSNYAFLRETRGRCDAAVRALNLTVSGRIPVLTDIQVMYLLARCGGTSRSRALWQVAATFWQPAPPQHLALARAAVERRDWSTAAAELRLWEVWSWEDNAELQRSELREAALGLERGDFVAAHCHYVEALKLEGWGDRDSLSEMLMREVEGRVQT